MFRLPKPDEKFPTQVTVRVPNGDEMIEAECTIVFECVSSKLAAELSLLGNAAFLRRVVHGWDGIEGPDGEPIPYDADNLETMVNVPYFAASAVDAYFGRFHLAKNS